jgi:hypothetical protein
VNNIAANGSHEVATDYFDLQGRKVANPSNGLYIKRTVMSDGTVKAKKIIIIS